MFCVTKGNQKLAGTSLFEAISFTKAGHIVVYDKKNQIREYLCHVFSKISKRKEILRQRHLQFQNLDQKVQTKRIKQTQGHNPPFSSYIQSSTNTVICSSQLFRYQKVSFSYELAVFSKSFGKKQRLEQKSIFRVRSFKFLLRPSKWENKFQKFRKRSKYFFCS